MTPYCLNQIINNDPNAPRSRSCPICGISSHCVQGVERHDKLMSLNIITKTSIKVDVVSRILREGIEKETGRKIKTLIYVTSRNYESHNRPTGNTTLTSIDIEFES